MTYKAILGFPVATELQLRKGLEPNSTCNPDSPSGIRLPLPEAVRASQGLPVGLRWPSAQGSRYRTDRLKPPARVSVAWAHHGGLFHRSALRWSQLAWGWILLRQGGGEKRAYREGDPPWAGGGYLSQECASGGRNLKGRTWQTVRVECHGGKLKSLTDSALCRSVVAVARRSL